MASDISTMTNQEIASMFSSEFSEFRSSAIRQRVPIIPEIRLSVQMTKKNVPMGTWFLVDPNVPKGEEAKIEILGEEIEFTVLRDSMRLSYFSEEHRAYDLETSEFQSYTQDPVFLFDRRGGRLKISAFCPYSGPQEQTIAALRKEIVPTLPPKSNFGFEYLIYVLMKDGRIAVIRNTARGHLGTNTDDGTVLTFSGVSDDSYVRARAICHEATPGITCAHSWAATAVPVKDGEKEVRPAFKIIGFIKPEAIDSVKKAGHSLQENLHARYADRISFAWRNMSFQEKRAIVTSYQNLSLMLDDSGGDQEAAAMLMGKRSPKVSELLSGKEETDYKEMEQRNAEETRRKIEEFESDEHPIANVPEPFSTKVSIPDAYGVSRIDPADLPF